ncbi:MAG: type II secretion system protein [Hylemonella sp.]|uniref:pilus assembly FimT family protein n=1 Tax=Hylemonella sp. TaxID=2066020 RepID=UPI0022BC53AA|nr:type II secretion system protein [Hylemonella sp.]MCZ8251090.1 type II secretion system protein [Hylemonella sp.]
MLPPRPLPAAPCGARGFTLIELVMVILILGILAVFVLPRADLTRGFDEVGFHDAARSTLEYARKSAIAERRHVRVTLAGNNLTLTIDNVGPETAGAGTFPRQLALPTPDRRCGGAIHQLCAPPDIALGGPATLDFSPLGRASAAATYTVTGQPDILVEAETGHVR